MKKLVSLVLALVMVLASMSAVFAETTIKATLKTDVKIKNKYPENTVPDGIDPVTGEKSSGEAYTPILIVLDNAEDAYPHWGVSEASIIFQIPNSGKGATKLLALYTNKYPEHAGGVRSARITMLPVSNSFDAAFASGGYSPTKQAKVNVDAYLKKWGYTKNLKWFNLLGNYYKQRESFVKEPHNLSCNVNEIHQKLVDDKVEFKVKAFAFATEPLTRGEDATKIKIKYYTDKKAGKTNHASCSQFEFKDGVYYRTSATGVYTDRKTEEPVTFTNVIFMRCEVKSMGSYPYFNQHLKGKGPAEIFQNGKYIHGAWTRSADDSRLLFVDEKGNELTMQPGRSFIIITDGKTDVIYE